MSHGSKIEWTETTWNPITGCTKVGAGCDNCYAERFAERWRGIKGHPYENGFDIQTRPERYEQPLTWKKPKTVFVNSMSDLFHKEIKEEDQNRIFETMEQATQHKFQVLTKRSSIMKRYINKRYPDKPMPNHIWLGVSVENRQVKSRIDHLRETNAAVKFLSIEPLLEDLEDLNLSNIQWVIVGGESGPGARPIKEEWITKIRDNCIDNDVPFFFKQWGGLRPKSNGRILEGRHWDEYPVI